MAINVDISKITGINQVGNSYQRKSAVPLDYFSLFNTKAEAVAYAASNPVSYVGQVISYIDDTDNGKVKVCVIADTAGTLREVGTKPVGDGKSITVNEEGIVSILGADSANSLTLPRMKEDKSGIEWVPVSAIVKGDGNDNTTYEITALTKTSGEGDAQVTETYGIKVKTLFNDTEVEGGEFTIAFDVYTKTEVDAAIKVVADKVGVPAEGDTDTKTLYERIAAEIKRATDAESALSDRIGVAKDGDAAATGVYAYVDGVVEALVNGVDAEKIDSLNELIAWVEAHPAIVEELDERLDKVEGILEGIGGEGEKETVVEYVGDYVTNALGAYTNTETLTGLLDGKADDADLANYYTKEEADGKYAVAADVEKDYAKKATTLNDYGITDAYTKNEVDAKIGTPGVPAQGEEGKEGYVAPVEGTGVFANTYSKAELNALLDKIEGGSTESAASVARQLDEYKTSNNQRVKNVEDKVGNDVNGEEAATGLFLEVDQAREQADRGVANAATAQGAAEAAQGAADAAQGTANEALGKANTNANDILTLKGIVNGNGEAGTDGLVKRLAALEAEVGEVTESRIDALEGVTGQHTKDIAANTNALTVLNTNTIPALEQAIANEAKAREDADKAIHDKIGVVTEGKTVVDMINAVAGTIDFTPYAKTEDVANTYATIAALEAEAKRADEAEKKIAGDLASEIARADAAEKANATAIAALDATLKAALENDGEGLDSIKELAVWIEEHETDVIPVVNKNKEDIAALTLRVAANETAVGTTLPGAIADALAAAKKYTDDTMVKADGVTIENNEGTFAVKAISTDLLVQGDLELILNGGNAALN